ncbi:MAG: hypothetical protein Q8P51_01620 [Ignavibacteria bacterium]|nr:hypothetical protein [Ignavibacteria bacterium]
MIDDQVLEEPEEEEENEEEIQLQSEIERLIELLLPPASEQDIEHLAESLNPPPDPRSELIEKIVAAIERGKARQDQNDSIDSI